MKKLKRTLMGVSVFAMLMVSCSGNASEAAAKQNETPVVPRYDSSTPKGLDPGLPKTVFNSEDVKSSVVNLITANQRRYIKNSVGTEAYQCFTQKDYDIFVQNAVTRTIVQDLRLDPTFQQIIAALKKKSSNEQNAVITIAESSFRATWADLSIDPATAPRSEILKGQTEFGSKAEHDVALAIAGLIRESLRQ